MCGRTMSGVSCSVRAHMGSLMSFTLKYSHALYRAGCALTPAMISGCSMPRFRPYASHPVAARDVHGPNKGRAAELACWRYARIARKTDSVPVSTRTRGADLAQRPAARCVPEMSGTGQLRSQVSGSASERHTAGR